MKLGTQMQVPNTNTPVKFQGHSPIITPLPLTCVIFKVIVPIMYTLIFTPMTTLESNSVAINDIYIV